MPPSNVAFSYSRFSSPSQADGDSVRRQTALRDAWLKRHPEVKFDPNLTLIDSGVSGFKGEHRKGEGRALSRFVDLIDRGRVPKGATLIVESVDRLSRERPEEAVPFLLSIINKGVRIVTLSPTEMVFEQGMDMGPMMMLLLESYRGHGESARKKDLCSQAWGELKRKAREEKKPLGKNLHPAWVAIDGDRHVLIPEKAEAVRTVFELAAAGWSTPAITRHLNETGVPAIGRKGVWVRSYVQKILTDPAAVGTYQPAFGSDRKVKDGEPIEDYWPAVVSPQLYERVRAGMTERATRLPRRRPPRVSHPLQGLLVDALDGCGMYTLTLKGRKYVVSQKGFDDPRGDSHRRPFPLDALQTGLLSKMQELASADLFADPSAGELAAVTSKLAAAERRLRVAVERFEADPENATWAGKVDQYDRERRLLAKELAEVRADAANPLPERWEEAVALMAEREPARLRLALAAVVNEVRVLVVPRGQTRLCAAQVFFAGGAVRSYLIRWTRSVVLPHCRKPEVVRVVSFAEAGLPAGRDLRVAKSAASLEKLMLKHFAEASAAG